MARIPAPITVITDDTRSSAMSTKLRIGRLDYGADRDVTSQSQRRPWRNVPRWNARIRFRLLR